MTPMIALAGVLALVAASPAAAQKEQTLEEVCQQELCRVPRFKLDMGNQTYFESKPTAAFPILYGARVAIYPGETVYVEATVDGDTIKLLRAVPENVHPEKTLVLHFSQMEGKKDMLLELKNPFPRTLKFRMGFMTTDSAKIHGTSSCPIKGGLTNLEHWPFPIFQLILTEPRILLPSDSDRCQ